MGNHRLPISLVDSRPCLHGLHIAAQVEARSTCGLADHVELFIHS
jgi:hypothetical protein